MADGRGRQGRRRAAIGWVALDHGDRRRRFETRQPVSERRPLRRADADQERRRDAPGTPGAVTRERPAGSGRDDEAQRHRGAGKDDIGQPLEADRHRCAGQDAGGGGGPAGAVAPRHRRHQQHRDRDLHVVMIDGARLEVLERRHCARRNHQPLPDGNKRTGYDVMMEFIERNGHSFEHVDGDILLTANMIEQVSSKSITEEEFIGWISGQIR